MHNLPALLAGEIDELTEALREYKEEQRLAEVVEDTE
jgi:hypothetical protein